MANISHFTQTVNGVSTTYDIHDAGAIPRSGGNVLTGEAYKRSVDGGSVSLHSGTAWDKGAYIELSSATRSNDLAGSFMLQATTSSSSYKRLVGYPDGTLKWNNKNVAMQEDVVPRSGGAVMIDTELGRTVDNSEFRICGGTAWTNGASVLLYGKDKSGSHNKGKMALYVSDNSNSQDMSLYPDGTWTWSGQPCQTASDQRLKQQITEIDDKLLDAWEDVKLSQFKYNDAVEQKGKDKARLHTGYVVQQIDSACKKHGVDISAYGLYCHEVYPEEVEEVEVEQADGTKTKETRVIREASEHYSLRYTEALIVECKYLRRCVERLTARIEELEKGNNSK